MVEITPKLREYFVGLLGKDEAEKLIHAAKHNLPIFITGPQVATGKTTLVDVLRAIGCTQVWESWHVTTIQVHEPLNHLREKADIFEELGIEMKC